MTDHETKVTTTSLDQTLQLHPSNPPPRQEVYQISVKPLSTATSSIQIAATTSKGGDNPPLLDPPTTNPQPACKVSHSDVNNPVLLQISVPTDTDIQRSTLSPPPR